MRPVDCLGTLAALRPGTETDTETGTGRSPGYTSAMAPDDERELDFYRQVEDLFAGLRGVPHTLSPADFQLMRDWWRDRVPLAAVRTGVTEVFARRRARGDDRPVVSLAYCRHAVAEHAKRLAEMQVGAHTGDRRDAVDVGPALSDLAERLEASADALAQRLPRVAAVITGIASTLRQGFDTPRALVEEHLYALESSLLGSCLRALDEDERRDLEERARHEAEALSTDPEARERSFRALRDRLLRSQLGLPRLEIGP